MPGDYLHNHPQFRDLIRIVAQEKKIDPALVEKDYWIMHCLYGLQKLGMKFELKGGTSLSKGFQIIDRFSEDIDIRIEPPEDRGVKTKPNQNKAAHKQTRKDYYDWLAQTISIDGVTKVARDTDFDDLRYYRSGGIRLFYESFTNPVEDLKEAVLLEAGFDDVTPNIAKGHKFLDVRLRGRTRRRNHRQPREGYTVLRPWLHSGRKTTDHFHKISSSAGERRVSRQFYAPLL